MIRVLSVHVNASAIRRGKDGDTTDGTSTTHSPARIAASACVSEDGYATGPPELIVEVASNSESIDLHAKRHDYEQAGVLEYVVIVLRQRGVRWFVLQDGTYRKVEANTRGLFKSTVFSGLWLDAPALLRRDVRQVMATLQHGIEMPEHAAFVQQLQARRRTS